MKAMRRLVETPRSSNRCREIGAAVRPTALDSPVTTHIRAPPQANRAPPTRPARRPRQTPPRESSGPGRGRRDGKLVVQAHAGDVLMDDLQDVIEVDRAEREAEHEAERRRC